MGKSGSYTPTTPHEILTPFSTVLAHFCTKLDDSNTIRRRKTPTINKFGSGPFLMSQNVASLVGLGALDKFNVCFHAILREGFRKLVRDVGVRVETSEGDELEEADCQRPFSTIFTVFRDQFAIKNLQTKLAKLPNKLFHLLGAETGGGPVEGRRKVVGEPLAGDLGVDAVGELLGLSVDGGLGLHPDEVGVGGEGDGTVDGALGAALVAEVALLVRYIRKNCQSATLWGWSWRWRQGQPRGVGSTPSA